MTAKERIQLERELSQIQTDVPEVVVTYEWPNSIVDAQTRVDEIQRMLRADATPRRISPAELYE